jgi:PAS domain S-box-containing protein
MSATAPAAPVADAVLAFVANAPISVVMTDAELRVMRASPRWLRKFGLPEKAVLGRSFYELAPTFRKSFETLQARCLAGEELSIPPERVLTRAGTHHWIARDAGPWRYEDGRVGGLLIVMRDVTAEKALQEEADLSRAFLDTILDNVPMPMVVKDEAGRIVRLNRAMLQVNGERAGGQIGKTVFEFLPEKMARTIHDEDRRAMASPEPIIEEVDSMSPTGRRFVRKIKAVVRDPHGARYLLAITQDLTKIKQSEEVLKQALDAAEAANRSKSEFLANMSHEIRTPLNGVLGLADALSHMELTPQQREIVDMILNSGKALTAILSDVLDLAKAEAGQLSLDAEPFSLRETISAAGFLFEAVARGKGLDFRVEFAEPSIDRLVGDPLRIKQIVSNLVSNAVKFTSKGSVTVRAAAAVDETGGAMLEVSVSDTGPGFSEDVRRRLFGRFEQGDGSVTRRFGGTGLGLSIAGALADMMGGGITCSGAEGEGATFVLRAPLGIDRSVEVDAHPPQRTEAQLERRLRVLLAEDHEINQKVIQLMLGDVAELIVTADGQAALDAFMGEGVFDLVLMDTQMPVMDGLTAIRRIREAEMKSSRPRTPIISLTANAMAHQVQASLDAGADLHLAKPISSQALFQAINTVLEAREAPGARVA